MKLSYWKEYFKPAYTKANVIGNLWVLDWNGQRHEFNCLKRKGFWKKFFNQKENSVYVWNKTTGDQFFLTVYIDANSVAIYETWEDRLNNPTLNKLSKLFKQYKHCFNPQSVS